MPLTFAVLAADSMTRRIKDLLESGEGWFEDTNLISAFNAYQAHLLSLDADYDVITTDPYTFNASETGRLTGFPFVRIYCDGYLEFADREVGGPPLYEYTMIIEVVDRASIDPASAETALEQVTKQVEYHSEPLRALLEANKQALGLFDIQDVQFSEAERVDSDLYRSVTFSLLIHST